MKKFHIAIGTQNIQETVKDYSNRLSCEPDLVIENQYALWRTETLNFSIRKVDEKEAGLIRHIGWEDADATTFTADTDTNNILWEHFNAGLQAKEIEEAWPGTGYIPKK